MTHARRPPEGATPDRTGGCHLSAVFLDRDGVINRRRIDDWVRTPDQLELLPGAVDAIARLTKAGLSPVVVSNQSGIGRGLMTRAEVELVNLHLFQCVERAGGRIRGILICPHAPIDGCGCRKPGIGLFKEAASTWEIDLARSAMIGDAASDIEAARRAGLALALLVTDPVDGYPANGPAPDASFRSLGDAVDWLLGTCCA